MNEEEEEADIFPSDTFYFGKKQLLYMVAAIGPKLLWIIGHMMINGLKINIHMLACLGMPNVVVG